MLTALGAVVLSDFFKNAWVLDLRVPAHTPFVPCLVHGYFDADVWDALVVLAGKELFGSAIAGIADIAVVAVVALDFFFVFTYERFLFLQFEISAMTWLLLRFQPLTNALVTGSVLFRHRRNPLHVVLDQVSRVPVCGCPPVIFGSNDKPDRAWPGNGWFLLGLIQRIVRSAKRWHEFGLSRRRPFVFQVALLEAFFLFLGTCVLAGSAAVHHLCRTVDFDYGKLSYFAEVLEHGYLFGIFINWYLPKKSKPALLVKKS